MTMIKFKEANHTHSARCAKEVTELLSKINMTKNWLEFPVVNRDEDLAGIICDESKPYGEISMTGILTELVVRTLDYPIKLRWYIHGKIQLAALWMLHQMLFGRYDIIRSSMSLCILR